MKELELLEAASSKKVLFCGERIIDVYHYVDPLGRPTKEAIVAVELVNTETFEGGVMAASRHVQPFVKNYAVYNGGRITTKRRYVEKSHFRKLFETYETDPAFYDRQLDVSGFDTVVVLDYGHGMATPEFIAEVSKAKYLAVNVQTNSGNYGFNLATKYPRADYLCVDEPEARLATQNRNGPIEDSIEALGKSAQKVVVTRGKAGAIGYEAPGCFCYVPAFTDAVVDTIGAGDAFFAITSLVADRASIEQILRIGNAAGAIKIGIVGHRSPVTKDELTRLLGRIPPVVDHSIEERRSRR